MENKDKPAFPCTDGRSFCNDGVTKREYFAALAMQGMLSANPQYTHGNIPLPVPASVAQFSVEYADALIKALNNH